MPGKVIDILRNSSIFSKPEFNQTAVGFKLGELEFDLRVPGERLKKQLTSWYKGFNWEPEDGIVLNYLPSTHIPKDILEYCLENNTKYRNVQLLTRDYGILDGEIAVFRWDFRALLDVKKRKGHVLLLVDVAASIDAAARIAASIYFPSQNSLLVHGASIEIENQGYVFMGPSRSGKSTIAETSGANVLNDEISLLSIDKKEVFVQGTPFFGDLKKGANLKVPVGRLLFLKKDKKTYIESLDSYKQILALLRNVICFHQDFKGFDDIHKVAEKILEQCPLQILHFEKNKNFMEVI